jgi:tight adherence protein C
MQEEHELPPFARFCASVLSLLGIELHGQKEVAMQLAQAGLTSPGAVAYFLFFKRAVQPALLVLGGIIFLHMILSAHMTGSGKVFSLLMALLMLGVGISGAGIYVTNLKQRRQKILLRAFPEMLDLLLVCIESGLGLDASLARVCAELRKTSPVMTAELDRTRTELTMLADRSQALQNLADRTEILPFKSLISSLIQTEKFGTSLVDTLRVLSDDQRTTRLLNAENRAARIPVLITIPLIFCILPAFVLIILGPPMVKVAEQGGIFGKATPK